MENELIKKDLIFIDKSFTDQKDLLMQLSEILEEEGYVKSTFLENILSREKQYPTGLDTGEIKVAIPHTDSENVLKPCLALCTLEKPVNFKQMDDMDKEIPVDIIFMLAIKDPKLQVPTLTNLMSIFSQSDVLEEIHKSKSKNEIYEILVNNLN